VLYFGVPPDRRRRTKLIPWQDKRLCENRPKKPIASPADQKSPAGVQSPLRGGETIKSMFAPRERGMREYRERPAGASMYRVLEKIIRLRPKDITWPQ